MLRCGSHFRQKLLTRVKNLSGVIVVLLVAGRNGCQLRRSSRVIRVRRLLTGEGIVVPLFAGVVVPRPRAFIVMRCPFIISFMFIALLLFRVAIIVVTVRGTFVTVLIAGYFILSIPVVVFSGRLMFRLKFLLILFVPGPTVILFEIKVFTAFRQFVPLRVRSTRQRVFKRRLRVLIRFRQCRRVPLLLTGRRTRMITGLVSVFHKRRPKPWDG